MARHIVEGKEIVTWQAFHEFFAKEFGFPDYYGKNMDAWIDCMSEPIEDDIINLVIRDVNYLKSKNREIYDSLIECSAFVNWRIAREENQPVIALTFHD